MKQLFTVLICSIVGGLSAQSADWNPDANGDGLVGSSDLLALLTAYGESFVPPLEDDAWVECTEEHYNLVSDTIFPSDFELLCDTDILGGCTAFNQWLDLQADTAVASTELSFWEYQDSLFLEGLYSAGCLTHVVTWQNTCNSINMQTIREQLNLSPDSAEVYRERLFISPPYYDEGSRLRILRSDDLVIPEFLREIGLDVLNEREFICPQCDVQISNTLIPSSYGSMRVLDSDPEPGVYFQTIAEIQNGVWFIQ